MKIDPHTALIIVHVQKDFCAGGALAVPQGDEVVPVMNLYIDLFLKAGAPIYATRDWHPFNHCSFKPQGGPWPIHCVQGTLGAQFHPHLALPKNTVIISSAYDPRTEAYSGFDGTDLASRLTKQGIQQILVGGLATEYCVKSTVLDGLKAGFKVYFLSDASRAINAKPEDEKKAVEEMVAAGARSLTLDEILPRLASK